MKVFFSNYHISVNKTLVDDLLAVGLEVVLPNQEFHTNGHIDFYAPNTEHVPNGAKLISYEALMKEEPLVLLIPCIQMVPDFLKFYEDRGKKDVLCYLTANSSAIGIYPDIADYVMSHDLLYHRYTKAKFKMLYFNRPTLYVEKKNHDDLRRSFEEKKIKVYVNNFDKEGFEPEYEQALKFKELWQQKTGNTIPFYGYGMKDGWPKPWEVQKHMVDSMFTLVFKRRETWGQMVNESMLLGTPGIFLNQYRFSTFTQYLINEDTAIVGDTVEELIEKIDALSWEQYQSLVNESFFHSQMFCNDELRRQKVRWLFDKIEQDDKMKGQG